MPSHQRIRQRRIAMGLSLEDVARKLEPYWPSMTKSLLGEIERGERRIVADELPFIARALECRPEDLLDPLPD